MLNRGEVPPLSIACDSGLYMYSPKRVVLLIVLSLFCVFPPEAFAGANPPESQDGARNDLSDRHSLQQTRLTGDWSGKRQWLRNHGIDLESSYTFEIFSNVAGGVTTKNATKPLGDFNLMLTLDSEKLGLWKGGSLLVHGESLAGDSTGINAEVGFPINAVSNINAPSFTQLSEFYMTQSLAGGRLTLKGGKQYASTDFIASNITCLFINDGLNPPANIPMSNFPDAALGFEALFYPADLFSFYGGVYSSEFMGKGLGTSSLFQGEAFWIMQPAIHYSFGNYKGVYRFGAWLNDQDTPAVAEGPKIFSNNYGVYILFDQQIYKADPGQQLGPGLSAYFQFSWAPADRNDVDLSIAGGLVYMGLIPGREEDNIGFSVITSRPTSEGLTNETDFELFYQANVTPWLTVQPDIQYFNNPAGDGRNAFAIGLRSTITF